MSSPVKLMLAGDVMLGRLVNESLCWNDAGYPWGDTLALWREADWRACNLECVIGDRGSPWARSPKLFHFRSDAKNVQVLKAARIDAVTLANNHTLDYNHRGLVEMLKILDQAGIGHTGAGLNDEEAARPLLCQVRGLKLAVLAFTDNEPGWEAGQETPGVCYVPVDAPDSRTDRLLDRVRAAKQAADIVIVGAHWGSNWGNEPPAAHQEMARRLAAAGADIIFGHSAHVFRGVEIIHGSLVLYSTGDFVDDYAVSVPDHNDRSWLFEVEISDHRISRLLLHPTVIRSCQARRAESWVAEEMVEAMSDRCERLGTTAIPDLESEGLVIEAAADAARIRPHLSQQTTIL